MVVSTNLIKIVVISFWFTSWFRAVEAADGSFPVQPRSTLRGRTLSDPAISTTDCTNIRLDPYPAELQLVYEYSVEFAGGQIISLSGLERAVAYAVAFELDICDDLDRPLYKVKTDIHHSFSKSSVCVPTVDVGNACVVVTGATAILVDDDSVFLRTKAFQGIQNGLNDTELLQMFTDFVVKASFIAPINVAVVEVAGEDDDDDNEPKISSTTATVIAASVAISIVVASIFCYGYMLRGGRRHPQPSSRRRKSNSPRTNSPTVGSSPLGGICSRRQFVRLEELPMSPPTSFSTASMTPPGVDRVSTIEYSVSDITLDSISLPSEGSGSPSILDRIEEGEEDGHEGERDDENDYEKESFRSDDDEPEYYSYDSHNDDSGSYEKEGFGSADDEGEEDISDYRDYDFGSYDSRPAKSAVPGAEIDATKAYAEDSVPHRQMECGTTGLSIEEYYFEIHLKDKILDVSDLDGVNDISEEHCCRGNEYDNWNQNYEADTESEVHGDRFVEANSDLEISSDDNDSVSTKKRDDDCSCADDMLPLHGVESGIKREKNPQEVSDDVLGTDYVTMDMENSELLSKGTAIPDNSTEMKSEEKNAVCLDSDGTSRGSQSQDSGDEDEDDGIAGESHESGYNNSTSSVDGFGRDNNRLLASPDASLGPCGIFDKQNPDDSIDEWVSRLFEATT